MRQIDQRQSSGIDELIGLVAHVTGMVPFSESGAFGSENAYTSVLCELGTPAKGLAGVVVLLLTMFGLVTRFPDPVTHVFHTVTDGHSQSSLLWKDFTKYDN